jgi:hypothetical protein
MKLNKLLKSIRRLKLIYQEQGRLSAEKEFNRQIKKLSTSHSASTRDLIISHNNELDEVINQNKKLKTELSLKIEFIEKTKQKTLEKQSEINLIHSEVSRYYNNLRDKYDDERRQKMASIEYNKSSADHLLRKSQNISKSLEN